MSGSSTHPARSMWPFLPAWSFSILMHLSAIALLFGAIRQSPRGAVEARRGSMGLVLNRANAESALDRRNQFAVTPAVAVAEAPLPPPLFVVAANDTEQAARAQTDDSANSPKAVTHASATSSKPAAKQSKSGGKAGSRPATTGPRFGSSVGSGYAQTSVFGVQGKGNKFIYVFDRSASMEGAPLAAAKRQLLQSLQSLDSVHQFHILFFNTRVQAFDVSGGGHRIAFATDRNKRLAANFVGGITADGGTDRMFALREALNFAPDVIFFLTDADDPMSPSELAEVARANRNVQAAICAIEFGKDPAPKPNDFLARLARESGGQYGYVNTTTLPAEQSVSPAQPGAK
jgi:von Willebrand factor type A domain